jgi:putative Mg2+ transporter-C (MgtC) family protein
VWVTAAVGAAAGAGLPLLAVLSTGVYFVVAIAFPLLTQRLPRSGTAMSVVHVRYPDGRGILRDVLALVTERGFAVDELATTADGQHILPGELDDVGSGRSMVEVTLQVHGRGVVSDLAAGLSELPAVKAVVAEDVHSTGE